MDHLSPGSQLLARKDRVIRTWMARVRERVPAAATQDDETVRDSLPSLLDELAHVLDSHEGEGPSEEISRLHARQRAAIPDYTLEQVVLEYRLLRLAITDAIEAGWRPMTLQERDRLNEVIDYGIGQAGREFMQVHLQKVHGDLRKLREERELRDRFVSTLSHDLRSPLTAVELAAQNIRRLAVRPEVRTLAEKSVRNLRRADRMIRDLLDVSRVQAGELLQLNVAECSLREVAASVVEDMTSIHGPRFHLEAPDEARGFWSGEHLRRVLENLVSNAVKHGDPRGAVVVQVAQDAHETTLRVHNDGPPIARREQESIFDAFRRARPEGPGASVGWGLGLTLVRAVVEAHGGRVSVESTEERGTTFQVVIPNDARLTQHHREGTQPSADQAHAGH